MSGQTENLKKKILRELDKEIDNAIENKKYGVIKLEIPLQEGKIFDRFKLYIEQSYSLVSLPI